MQAMINTAWISFDPMTNGQKLSEQLWDYMVKQQHWQTNNPGSFW
jgi:hypothetical protein